eukprot:3988690-Amphidinium_carterae.2
MLSGVGWLLWVSLGACHPSGFAAHSSVQESLVGAIGQRGSSSGGCGCRQREYRKPSRHINNQDECYR